MSDSLFLNDPLLNDDDPWALPSGRPSSSMQSSIIQDNNWNEYNSNDILSNRISGLNINNLNSVPSSSTIKATDNDSDIPFSSTIDPLASPREMDDDGEDSNDDEDDSHDKLVETTAWSEEMTRVFNPLSFHNSDDKSIIKVKEIPEKEGLVFKHTNYLVTHNLKFASEYYQNDNKPNGSSETKVIRRYSDFAWLLEVLWKKYPFRLIPELPPKKFPLASSNDSIFLQRRRRGLQRFLYQLNKHPILSKENLVIMFLTVPNDFSNWKKFANIEINDEFDGIRVNIPRRFRINLNQVMKGLKDTDSDIDDNDSTNSTGDRNATNTSNNNDSVINNITQIWNESPVHYKKLDFWENLNTTNNNLTKFADIWSKLCILVERIEKRDMALWQDHQRFSLYLDQFVQASDKVYGLNNIAEMGGSTQSEDENLSIIKTILKQVTKYLTSTKQLKDDELNLMNSEILESFKRFQDYLTSLHFLIERLISYKNLAEKQIHTLLNRITRTNERLFQIKIKSDIKGSEVDKLITILTQSSDELNSLITRIILIKSAFYTEFQIFQKTKYLISETFQDWFIERVKYGELYQDALQRVFNDLQDMPLK
ncbi:hypothetical protein CANARDRAFT_29560 [[Candida] arabinofermentans NRRL YB-2248]|uniref:Sorting nexin MVP1 n=1 Tax=[Candida] arabinofermentans NRRL YB-2248 TaxID=983967 RepID=A0A1E4SWH2_9ASCO|nr:hypothetical protein CANARDRAFT_29560 [[Candida] arabinofermentans NRRL YB-2248]